MEASGPGPVPGVREIRVGDLNTHETLMAMIRDSHDVAHPGPNQRRIPVCRPKLGESERRLVNECLKGGWVSGISPYVERFEDTFARYCGAKYGVACNSGTTALHLALVSLGLEKETKLLSQHLP